MGLDFIEKKRDRHHRCESKALQRAKATTLFDGRDDQRRSVRGRLLVDAERVPEGSRLNARLEDNVLFVFSESLTRVAEVANLPGDLLALLAGRPLGTSRVVVEGASDLSETVEVIFDKNS